jgi:hypothetical protein
MQFNWLPASSAQNRPMSIKLESPSPANSFMERLRNAGIEASDSEEVKLNKSLLMLATGLASVAIVLWVAIYWALGARCSPPPCRWPSSCCWRATC